MDEENQGFAIPAKRPMFGEGDVSIEARPLPESEFFMAFANEAGDKAVILTSVETVGDEVLERHGRAELEGYAQGILEGEPDDMGLQIGDIFNGETAEEDAKAEAFRLDEELNPGEGAPDDEVAMAVDAAKANAGTEEESAFPEDMEGGEGLGAPELEAGTEIGELEEEPMLGQLKKKRPGV